MVDVSHYKLADCTLFRTPPIDVSPLQKKIEQMLVDAWRSGESAEVALGSIVGNEEFVQSLAAQIRESLEFQKSQALGVIEMQKAAALEQYGVKRDAAIMSIEDTVGVDVANKQRDVDSAASQFQQTQAAYGAVNQNLDELRGRVRRKIDSIGGVDNYKTLVRINQELNQEAPSKAASLSSSYSRFIERREQLRAARLDPKLSPNKDLEPVQQVATLDSVVRETEETVAKLESLIEPQKPKYANVFSQGWYAIKHFFGYS